MKKLILLLSAGLFLTGCGSSSTGSSDSSASGGSSQAQSEQKEEVKDFDQVLVDNENIKVEITKLDPNDLFGYAASIYMENKTNLNLMFAINDSSINGVMMDPFFADTVSAGMKSNDTVTWSKSDLNEAGITVVTQIELRLHVYNNDDWTADPIDNTVYTIYPLGQDSAALTTREKQDSDIVLVDNDQVAIRIINIDPNDTFGYTLHAYIENKTDRPLMYTVEDSSINGFMVDPFWATDVQPHKVEYTDINFSTTDLQANNITTVETISLPIRVYDDEDFSAVDILNDTYTITPGNGT